MGHFYVNEALTSWYAYTNTENTRVVTGKEYLVTVQRWIEVQWIGNATG